MISFVDMRFGNQFRLINTLFAVACAFALAWYFLISGQSFSNEGFMPHGHCYLWTPSLVWTMVITDGLIGTAYLSISICLYVLVRRIQLPFSAMFLAFGAFIGACGGTHFMSIYTLWFPNYWLDALIKVITALASVATAILIFPLFPRIVSFATAARLSEQRKRQLEELNLQLEAKTDDLTTSNRELEAFSYSVSHDLRTPLRGIAGFSDALLEDYGSQLDDKGKEYLNHVRNGAERMGRIIDDLLSLSRISRSDLTTHNVNLTLIARQTIEHLQLQAPGRSVEIFIQEGVEAMGDAGLLRNVMENLLSNAWKFTSKKVGARIEFGSELQKDGRPAFFIRDNGTGFDTRFSDKLFGAFQRFHSYEEYSGTGVGLAIAKRIIDRHRGRIWVRSQVGQGTTFYFSLDG